MPHHDDVRLIAAMFLAVSTKLSPLFVLEPLAEKLMTSARAFPGDLEGGARPRGRFVEES